MTPDPLNDPVVNYGWRRLPVEEKLLLSEDQVFIEGHDLWCEPLGTAPCIRSIYRRRIQPPPGHELIGLDEVITDNGGFNGKTPREVLKDDPHILSFFRLFRPIKPMSEIKEYHRAVKIIVSYEDNVLRTRREREEIIGYFEGDDKVVFKFIEDNGHWPFRLEPIAFRQITEKDIDDLKAARIGLEHAEAALKAIKV